MFTGLVEGLGTVAMIESEPAGLRITISPPAELTSAGQAGQIPTGIGDSISINGCCLTVIAVENGNWTFQAGKETLSKTSLGDFQLGDRVNLERSLPANGRLGGHFVQGHVDGVGTIASIDTDDQWVTMLFRVPRELIELMVPKGSVAVDGISLTVVDVNEDSFSVALIPHTLQVTTLGQRTTGQRVNIETDILGKYAHKFMNSRINAGR